MKACSTRFSPRAKLLMQKECYGSVFFKTVGLSRIICADTPSSVSASAIRKTSWFHYTEGKGQISTVKKHGQTTNIGHNRIPL